MAVVAHPKLFPCMTLLSGGGLQKKRKARSGQVSHPCMPHSCLGRCSAQSNEMVLQDLFLGSQRAQIVELHGDSNVLTATILKASDGLHPSCL